MNATAEPYGRDEQLSDLARIIAHAAAALDTVTALGTIVAALQECEPTDLAEMFVGLPELLTSHRTLVGLVHATAALAHEIEGTADQITDELNAHRRAARQAETTVATAEA